MFKMNYITKLILSFIMFFALSLSLYAKKDSGINLLQFGGSASALGRGGTGVSAYGSDLFYLNPASVTPVERLEFGMQYGTLGLVYQDPAVSFAMPTSYGVIGSSFRMINIPAKDAADIEKAYLFKLGGAKNFTDRFMIGVAVNYFGAFQPVRNNFFGVSLGALYKIDFEINLKGGFGIYEPAIGASVDAGIPFGTDRREANFNQSAAGYNLIFFKNNDLNIKFYNDISAINRYKNYPVKFGFESIIRNNYILRAGFTAPQYYDYGDYTFGAGYIFKAGNFDGDVNYSLVHYSKLDFIHYAGINIRYGKLDREAPETGISATEQYISPNYDGRQDYIIFNTEVEDVSKIKGWKLQVLNSIDEVVKEYRVSERDIDEGLTLKGFFRKIWQKKESMVVPEKILWDGTDNAKKNVPDGKYTYSFIVWDERDNISAAKTGTVFADNTPPEAILESDLLFSPNGDNKKDTLEVKLNVISAPEDSWNAGFINSEGRVVKSFKWSGASAPKKIAWDGRDDSGRDAAEGLYSFFAGSTDRSGNRVRTEKKQITLTRKYQASDITCSNEYFSYNVRSNIVFYPYLSDAAGLEEWKISIFDDDDTVIKEIKGSKTLPESYSWMPDADEKKLKDGKYFFMLDTVFDSGNAPVSYKKEIIIDSSPPRVSIDYSPKLFSPDDDGENDVLEIYPEARDEHSIKDWTVDIYAPSGKIFKSYSGKTAVPENIRWDGIGKDKDLVESAADYFLVLKATDLAGNLAQTDRVKLPVDVLVTVTERGLKIRISNIEFAFDKSELTGKAFPILNRVTEILNKYGKYNILIEGHTDDIGEEEYNLKLSEARAKNVMDYLISKGIIEKRLMFRGMGETMPFLPNTDNENRRRNRRVEFLLIKEEINKPDTFSSIR